METICKVCDRKGYGMISIFHHPDNVDQIFSSISGIDKISENDALCIPCYDDMKIAFNFKKKCQTLNSQKEYETKSSQQKVNVTKDLNDAEEVKIPISLSFDSLAVSASCDDDDDAVVTCDESSDVLLQNDNEQTRNSADVNMQIDSRNVNTISNDIIFESNQKLRQTNTDTDEVENNDKKQTDDTMNGTDKTTKCEYCLVNFNSRSELNAHVIQHDIEKKPYRCQYKNCDKSFKNQSTLKKHSILHFEKRFQCQICERKFHELGNLRTHERYHSGERPYVCDKCGQSFYESGALKTHYRRHTGECPYICLHCAKQFSRSSAYKVHIRTHTNDKPYKCDECDKRFISSGKLLMHKRTKSHSGCRPYSCANCSSTFIDKYHLVKHMKLRHS